MSSTKQRYSVGVVGGRNFDDYDTLKGELDEYIEPLLKIFEVIIVSGGAEGVDKLAAKYAVDHKLGLIEHLPDWSLGKKAGPVRNKLIVDGSDEIIAFWDGQSKGTASTIKLAKKAKKMLNIIRY